MNAHLLRFFRDADVGVLADAAADLLYAIDRGDFGDAFRHGPPDDRHESAYVTALRIAVASYADHALTADAHRRGAEITAALSGEARS